MHQLELFQDESRGAAKPMPLRDVPHEYKVIALRDCPIPSALMLCDSPQRAVDYWRLHIATTPQFNPDCECLVVLLLNTRKRVKGHQIVSTGLLDQALAHSREVFRSAIVAAAHSVVLMHNHPSGDPIPSDSDVRVTHELVRAGQLLKIHVVDHIIVGHDCHTSIRELGLLNP